MIKKTVSMLLLVCIVFTCIPFGMVFAQSDEDYIRSIPIVEFVPTRNGESKDYSKAKIICVDKDVALATDASVFKSLISEDCFLFFKDMTITEVNHALNRKGVSVTSHDANSLVVGTSLTAITGRIALTEHHIEYVDCCENLCDACKHMHRVDSIEHDVSDADYEVFAREAYAAEFLYAATRSSLPDCDQAIQIREKIKHWGFVVGSYNFIIAPYPKGIVKINGKQTRVYDIVASCSISPTGNAKVNNIDVTLGSKDSNNYDVLHATTIPDNGVEQSIGLTLTGDGIEIGTSWSFSSSAFTCTNNHADFYLKTWKMKPVKPKSADSWEFAPGIRMYALNKNTRKGHVFYEISGHLKDTLLWQAWAYESNIECSFDI
ncbi:MAG: hypothetical protein IKZ82_01060 [Clostridia bacterium]|nr:hypothetical protein [Clostridia bacterium]